MRSGCAIAACLVAAAGALAVLAGPVLGDEFVDAFFAQKKAQAVKAQAEKANLAITGCAARHKAYRARRAGHERVLSGYWDQIVAARRLRRAKAKRGATLVRDDYILSHPPVYAGPKRPKCRLPPKKPTAVPAKPAKPPKPRAVVADFLGAAKRIYGLEPRRVSEAAYMRTYARQALTLGLTPGQVIGVYALETGGIGPYARQSGIFITDQNCVPIAARGRAASSALGYAQLLAANSNAMVARHGDFLAGRLRKMAARRKGGRAAELVRKARILEKMVGDIRRATSRYKRRNGWREYIAFGKTGKGQAVHALNLDGDIGPLVQVVKLAIIRDVAARKGFASPSGAQMELMNLVGYGRGLEMMRPVAARVPTANFFGRNGYERNPVAKKRNAGQLLDHIGAIIKRKMSKCGSKAFQKAFRKASRERLAAAVYGPRLPAPR